MQTLSKNNNSNVIKSTNELKQIMEYVLQRARELDATDAAVGINLDKGFAVDVRMHEVETVEFSEDRGVSVTVYIGQRKGSASSTDASLPALDTMIKAAIDIARVSAEDRCFGLADKALVNNEYPDLDLYHPWDILPAKAIELALACEDIALNLDKRIINSDGVNVSTYTFSHGYANTHGCEGVVHSSRHSISCSLIAKDKDSMQRDYDYTTSRRASDLLPIDQLAQRVVERSTSRIGARQVKTRKTPVLFSPRVSSGLFSTFITAISGANLYRKNSFLLDCLGTRIFPETITIHEQPYLLNALGSSPFDSEGVPTRNNVFVEHGVLHQYALGSYSARRLGLETTANSGGVFNLTIEPTAGDFYEVLNLMDTGLLVTELMGQGVNVLTGDYSRGASGFWVEGGKIQYPVEEITIAGNLKDMFHNIRAVGQDINPNIATRCGSVLIEEMMMAGS